MRRGGTSSSSDSSDPASTDSESLDSSSDNSDDASRFEFNPAIDKNRPVTKNARITLKHSYIACLTFMIITSLTRTQSALLLHLINIHAEENIPHFESFHKFERMRKKDF